MREVSDVCVVRIHAAAPPKPAFGAPCNGCGACCAAEPCPVSRGLLGHRAGACPALQWHDGGSQYRCGMTVAPAQYLRWLPATLNPLAGRLMRRWVAIGIGCEFDAELS